MCKTLASVVVLVVATASLALGQDKDDGEESGLRKAGDIVQIVVPVTAPAASFIKKDGDGTWQLLKSFGFGTP